MLCRMGMTMYEELKHLHSLQKRGDGSYIEKDFRWATNKEVLSFRLYHYIPTETPSAKVFVRVEHVTPCHLRFRVTRGRNVFVFDVAEQDDSLYLVRVEVVKGG